MAAATVSKTVGGNPVGVRVPLPAPSVPPGFSAGSVFTAVGVCLRVAVRAQEANVLEVMIVAHAVEVVQMEDQRATAPLGYSAVGADVGKDSLIDETPLQAVAIGVRTVL